MRSLALLQWGLFYRFTQSQPLIPRDRPGNYQPRTRPYRMARMCPVFRLLNPVHLVTPAGPVRLYYALSPFLLKLPNFPPPPYLITSFSSSWSGILSFCPTSFYLSDPSSPSLQGTVFNFPGGCPLAAAVHSLVDTLLVSPLHQLSHCILKRRLSAACATLAYPVLPSNATDPVKEPDAIHQTLGRNKKKVC